MKSDKELLELAAKACGYVAEWYPNGKCDLVTLIKVIHEKWLAQQTPSSYQELADAFVLLWSSDDRAAWDKKAVEHFDSLLAKVESGVYLAPPTAIPEGYVLVRREPTEAMYQAGRDAPCVAEDMEWRNDYKAVWQAMLAAGEKK